MNIPEPKPESPTWPLVLRFAKLMEHKLEQNRDKGDAEAWRKDSSLNLLHRANDESSELLEALLAKTAEECALEAADVANFAMMIGDKMIENSNAKS